MVARSAHGRADRCPSRRRPGRGRRTAVRPHPDRHDEHRRHRDERGGAGRRGVGRLQARRRRHRVPDLRVRAGPGQPRRPHRGRPTAAGPALLVHGHLDVVPADPAEWSVHPFSGEERDGYIWGRGAVDMKDMDAMVLALVRDWARTGVQPPRDIVLAYVADEEAGGKLGARWLVDEHPDLFEGCTEAISEVGGFSITVRDDLRLYLVQTAEKGLAWMRLTAGGKPGPRLVRARRQRRHPALRGRRPARLGPPAHGAHPADAPVPRRRRGRLRHRDRPRRARGGARPARQHQPDDRRGPAQHGQPHDARRRLQGQRHPRDGERDRRRPLPLRPAGGVRAPARRAHRRGHPARVAGPRPGRGDDVRRPAGRLDGRRAQGRGRRRAAGARSR